LQLTDVEIHVHHLSLVFLNLTYRSTEKSTTYSDIPLLLGLFDRNEQPADVYSGIHHSRTGKFAVIALLSLVNNPLFNTTAPEPAPAVTSSGYTFSLPAIPRSTTGIAPLPPPTRRVNGNSAENLFLDAGLEGAGEEGAMRFDAMTLARPELERNKWEEGESWKGTGVEEEAEEAVPCP
jgi:hypothetical protein